MGRMKTNGKAEKGIKIGEESEVTEKKVIRISVSYPYIVN
jgi:hypothetical protein